MISSTYYSRFMLLILSVCMLMPMSIDIFISGLPDIQIHFPGENVALVMGASLIGLTFTQLIYGPLLDYFGRKPVMIAGLITFTLASVGVVLANSFICLILARFIQAAGGCSAVVGVIAVVKDTYPKEQLVSKMGTIMAMIGISPIIAPLIGGFANTEWGWRGSFWVLVFLGIIYIAIISCLFKESIQVKNKDALKLNVIMTNYLLLLKTPGYVTYCLTSGFTYCILFSYLNISAFIIMNVFGLQMISFGAIVAVNALAIVIMAKVAPLIAKKSGLNNCIYLGLALIILGGLSMLFINYIITPTLLTFMIPMFITTIGAGIIRPTANGGAMQLAPKTSIGSAAAGFNFISFGSGALVSIFSLAMVKTMMAFGIFISIFGLLAFLIMLSTFKNKNQ